MLFGSDNATSQTLDQLYRDPPPKVSVPCLVCRCISRQVQYLLKQSIIKFTSHTTVIWTGKLGKVDGISFFQYLPKNKQNIFVYFSYFNCCPFIRIWWLQLYATVCPVSRGCRQLSLKGGHWPEKRIHSIHSNQEWTSR